MQRIDNLHGGRASRAALVLIPTLFAVLGPMGVVASPFLSYGKTKIELSSMANDQALLNSTLAEHPELLDPATRERVRARIAAVDHRLPKANSPVLLHCLVRLLAEKTDVDLESLTLSDATVTGLDVLDDAIAARTVLLRGSGPMSALLTLPQTLESLGFPNTVSSFELVRADSSEPSFEISITLSLYERADPPSEDETLDESSEGGS